MPEVKYIYIADGSQVVGANKQIEDSSRRADAAMGQLGTKGQAALGGLEKSAVAAGQGAAVAGQGLVVLEQVASKADPMIAGLFAQIASMKTELGSIPVVTKEATAGITSTTGATVGLAAAFGSMTAVWAFAIPIAINIIGVLFEMATAKEKLIKIDKDQLDLDLRRNDLSERTTRIHGDLVTAFRILASQQKEYQLNIAKLNFDLEKLAQGSETRLVIDQKTGASYQQLHRNSTELAQGVALLNEKLGEQEKVLQPALEVILQHKIATGESTEETLKWAESMHFAGGNIDFFRNRLNALIPDIDEFTKKINSLKLPRADIASSLPGLGALQASVEATFQLARDQGLTDWADQVKFATPALKALDEALKQHAGTLKGYRAELAAQEPGMRSAIELMKEQQRVLAEEFAARKKVREVRDIGPQLEMEMLRASIALHKENFELRTDLIKREFEVRREEMVKNGQATEENLNRLKTIEVIHLTSLVNEHVAYYEKIQAERIKDAQKQEIIWLKEFDARMAMLVKQRQFREEEERKFFENQAKIERAARSNRAGRRIDQDDVIRREAAALREVQEAFGQASAAGRIFDEVLTRIAENGRVTFTDVQDVISAFGREILSVANIATALGNAIGNAFEAAISGTESFGKSLTMAVLNFIAAIAQQFGSMFILVGSGLILMGWPGGGALIGYGIALLALAGVLRGLANRIGQDRQEQAAGGASSGGATGSGAAGGPRPEPTARIIPFPTSGANSNGPMSLNIQLNRQGTKDFLGGKPVTEEGLSQSGGKQARLVRRIAS